jgi:hypothetical protein
MRRLLLALVLSSLPAGGALASVAFPEIYPTDRCVAAKLEASASACRALFDAEAFAEILPAAGPIEARREAARTALAAAFEHAEAGSEAAGVDCRQTTATAAEVFEALSDGASGIGAQVRSATSGARYLKRIRAFGGIRAAGIGCSLFVAAEADHLLRRQTDRARTRLERDQARAGAWLEALLRWSALDREGASEVGESVEGLADRTILAHIVSPNVSQDFVMIDPDDEVPYLGKTLEPICSRGTPWVHFVRRGTVNKLLVYYQGGGACWDYLTCEAVKSFKQTAGASDNPGNATTGFADLSNPENPFRDWSLVFVPYCTGDIHWGDAAVSHEFVPLPGNPDPNLPPVTIQHRGFVNAQVAEKFAREHFVDPEEVFVTGSSAGSYGAILNGVHLKERVYPSSQFSILGDAGNGVVPQDFLENQISKWNIEANLPSWIPELDKPVTELDASKLWAEAAKAYPLDRFANYSTAFDGGSGGQAGFFKIMNHPENFLTWLDWWTDSCEWNEGMRSQVLGAYDGAPTNYRYYIGSGSRHTMWGNNKVYTDTTGGVPTIVGWVNAMRDGSADWVNVETTDPGLLLPGDPRPNPASPPYTAEGRIVCEEPGDE